MADVANAQTTTASTAASTAAPTSGPAAMLQQLGIMPIMLIIFGLFYFLIIAPQKKEQKKKEEALKGIERGDKILTRGGQYGIVSDIKEQVLTVKIAENVKVEMHRDYVDVVEKNK